MHRQRQERQREREKKKEQSKRETGRWIARKGRNDMLKELTAMRLRLPHSWTRTALATAETELEPSVRCPLPPAPPPFPVPPPAPVPPRQTPKADEVAPEACNRYAAITRFLSCELLIPFHTDRQTHKERGTNPGSCDRRSCAY